MWGNKKQKNRENTPEISELPELPELPPIHPFESGAKNNLPPIPRKETLPALPSFKSSETANRIGNEAIKSAFNIPMKPRSEMPRQDRKSYTQEMPLLGHFRISDSDSDQELESSRRKEGEEDAELLRPVEYRPEFKIKEKETPVFVRIDKFEAAVRNLRDVKAEIANIESYLSEIRNLKSKEEIELTQWESQILEIKSKLDSLEKGIFSKMD